MGCQIRNAGLDRDPFHDAFEVVPDAVRRSVPCGEEQGFEPDLSAAPIQLIRTIDLPN